MRAPKSTLSHLRYRRAQCNLMYNGALAFSVPEGATIVSEKKNTAKVEIHGYERDGIHRLMLFLLLRADAVGIHK